jgi:glutaminyl-peptide cyclotransferase
MTKKQTLYSKNITSSLIILLYFIVLGVGCTPKPANTGGQPSVAVSTAISRQKFDGERAYQDVMAQVSFGPRIPGSPAHTKAVDYIQEELTGAGWIVDIQDVTKMDQPVRNIVGKRGVGKPWIILGAHYDSRLQADKDPDPALRSQPVPGANDGASGVSVLLELARVLPQDLPGQVWLVFFDAEDNGNLPGWEWILGSQAFVESLQAKPDTAIIIDMIGDTDLNIYQEKNSDPALTSSVWETARTLGYDKYFIPELKHAILDDHIPFMRAGIPAIDIIDIEYAHWHTTQDTTDKVSAKSLQIIGDTLYTWLVKGGP